MSRKGIVLEKSKIGALQQVRGNLPMPMLQRLSPREDALVFFDTDRDMPKSWIERYIAEAVAAGLDPVQTYEVRLRKEGDLLALVAEIGNAEHIREIGTFAQEGKIATLIIGSMMFRLPDDTEEAFLVSYDPSAAADCEICHRVDDLATQPANRQP